MTATWRALGLAAGIVVTGATLGSVFTTLVVPRMSSARMLRALSSGLGRGAHVPLRMLRSHTSRDRLLALIGPLGIVSLFVTWLVLLVVGFGLITWWAGGGSLGHSIEIAGSSVFTLGILTDHHGGPEAVEFVTAGTGLLVVALDIAYLPAIYAAFAARETEVTLLATRAGVPAWGPELLARSHRFSLMGELPSLFSTWERWSAAVAESHTNYPSLMWLRSPEPQRSWLSAMAAVMDAAALQNALTPGAAPHQSRLCLQVGTNCLRSLADALRIPYDADPLPTAALRLAEEDYLVGVARLEEAGFPFERSPEEAWRHFRGWRVNYEPMIDALASVLHPPPAPWLLVERPWLGEARYPSIINRTPDNPDAAPNKG